MLGVQMSFDDSKNSSILQNEKQLAVARSRLAARNVVDQGEETSLEVLVVREHAAKVARNRVRRRSAALRAQK